MYAEVAAKVPTANTDDTIHIFIDPQYRYKTWLQVLNRSGVQWNLEDTEDAIYRGFCHLPLHEMNVRITVMAPDRDDSGQIICLYKKVRALVSLLKGRAGRKGILSLGVFFKHTQTGGWFDESEPRRSIKEDIWGRKEPASYKK
jgi:hypothetical protein